MTFSIAADESATFLGAEAVAGVNVSPLGGAQYSRNLFQANVDGTDAEWATVSAVLDTVTGTGRYCPHH